MAAFGSLCQSWSILSGWNTLSCSFGFHSPFERNGALDGTKCRINSTNGHAFTYNRLYRLAKTGELFSEIYDQDDRT